MGTAVWYNLLLHQCTPGHWPPSPQLLHLHMRMREEEEDPRSRASGRAAPDSQPYAIPPFRQEECREACREACQVAFSSACDRAFPPNSENGPQNYKICLQYLEASCKDTCHSY